MRALSLCLLIPLLSGCFPVLQGDADLRLRGLMLKPSAGADAIAPLLAADVEVLRGAQKVTGVDAGAAALATLKVEKEPEAVRHHAVTLLRLPEGRTLLIERSQDDHILKAIEIPRLGPPGALTPTFTAWLAAWNTDPEAERLTQLEASFSAAGYYVDPGAEVTGREAMSKDIARLREAYKGSVLEYSGGPTDAGGGWATEDWTMYSKPGGDVLFRGIDIIHLDAEGKIDYLAGFFPVQAPR
jgi:hypothetical protein